MERKKINYVKSALENYYFVMHMATTKLLEIDNLSYQHTDNPVVAEEINRLDKEVDALILGVVKVDNFLKRLSPDDRIMLYNLYKRDKGKKHFRDYCYELGMSKSTLQRYVDKIILENWKD